MHMGHFSHHIGIAEEITLLSPICGRMTDGSLSEARRLIRVPSFEPAFAFGWVTLRVSISEWWGIYIAIALIGAALTAWGASAQGFRTAQVEWLAIFPALASAARLARPSFRMTFGRFCAIVVICLIAFVLPMAMYLGPFFLIVLTKFIAMWSFLLLVALFFIMLWLIVKLSLAPAFYALDVGRGATITGAVELSWTSVAGSNWWRVLLLGTCIGLMWCLIPGFVALGTFFAFRGSPTVAAFTAALVFYAGSIPAQIWTVGSLVALATALRPSPDIFVG